jgi:hypothetical protein
MSDPESWTSRDPNTIQVKYTGIYGENMTEVADWVTTFLPPDAEIVVYPMGNFGVDNGDFQLQVAANQYVYIDEDGLHCVDRGAFEMVYKKDTPA